MSEIETVSIMSPGEMGAAVGRLLVQKGCRVLACLSDRSDATARRAAEAGLTAADSFADAVHQSDLFISLVPPGSALDVARLFAETVGGGTRKQRLYLDCNSVSPPTIREISAIVTGTNTECVDGAFLGPADMLGTRTVLLVSGARSKDVEHLFKGLFEVRAYAGAIGAASALKSCFGAFNKGLVALFVEVVSAAGSEGAGSEIIDLLRSFYPGATQTVERLLPSYPRHVRRRIQEMEELHAWLIGIDHHAGFALATKEVFERLQRVDYRASPRDFETIMADILEQRPLSRKK